KTERDKTEILTKTERDKTELLEKMSTFYVKIDKDKREFIPWMIGLFFGFAVLNTTAIGIILTFAIK
ncbi:MAG: hypothetical protein LRZ90_06000, partial [Thermodesulfovibrionales bacterium]|nr:hypothetical protein [Thermodesulfovibrionales bacterium]